MNTEIIQQLFIAARDHDSNGKMRLAAAIYDRKKLIAMGFNNYKKSHPYQKRYGVNEDACFLHAEIHAIINARRSCEGLTIYVARAKKIKGRWIQGLARPCAGCERAIHDAGMKAFCFSLDDKGIGYVECW